MNIRTAPAPTGFRAVARDWLAENFPASLTGRHEDWVIHQPLYPEGDDWAAWKAAMADKGWAVPTWPAEYGGGGLSEAEIDAGRFDGAELRAWLVNWADTSIRWLQFRGTLGEIQRGGGAFRADLRGLTQALNRPLGRIYQKACTAVLGDGGCRFDLDTPGYAEERAVAEVEAARAVSSSE